MKDISTPAKRYATAFFRDTYDRSGRDGGEQVLEDVRLISVLFEKESKFIHFLKNEFLETEKKMKFIKTVIGGKIEKITQNFLEFLAFKKRIDLLPEIVACYLLFDEQARGVKQMVLQLASKDEKLEGELVKELEKKHECTFNLSVEYDKELIGGFKYQIDDLVYDCSMNGKLEKLKSSMLVLN